MGFNVWTFMCFIIFLCLSPVFGLHQCCHSKYHYSFHYSSFVLFLSVIYYFILNLLYCISLINPYNYLVSFFFLPGDVPSPLLYSIVPFELSLICSQKSSFQNQKTVVTCSCIEPGAVQYQSD